MLIDSVIPSAPWSLVVPVKGTPAAKSRMHGSPDLARALALDTVESALKVARVLVVTSAMAAAEFRSLGAEVILDPGGGLNAAIAYGIERAGNGPVAVLLGDLPALLAEELESVLGVAQGMTRSVVADESGSGTVITTALEPALHQPRFGIGSFRAHRTAGYAELVVPQEYGLRRDVDTRSDLVSLGFDRLGGHTREAVRTLGWLEDRTETITP
ncbi:2-phospho-L-lactate guanylyltransferase [Glaciihabitans sp. UYNi722]|uniref:2-phospho-L-lactate guanylyltransferase n=1 Tax=Glaciihabitans sp. UYNi722 TaxID=3156344 RepID=UPI003390E3C6